MNFNKHSDLEGEHAFLSGSKHSWINYDDEKISSAFNKYLAIQRGIELHHYAFHSIQLGMKVQKSKKAINQYINDAIGFRMTPEVVLFYSYNAFGTADSICFRDNKLRIHDLKTGASPVSIDQLKVYAALFCLEYHQDPRKIEMELRIYQSEDIVIHVPDPEDILDIMDKIVRFDKQIDKIRAEEQL